jgi:thiol-disulfide isomerase/thioredoxin
MQEIWLARIHTIAKRQRRLTTLVKNYDFSLRGSGLALPLKLFVLKQFLYIFIWAAGVLPIKAQQTIMLNMKSGLPCNGQVRLNVFWGRTADNPMLTRLKNDKVSRQSEVLNIRIANKDNDTLSFLVGSGITEKNELFAVADQNRDGDLGNDSVYIIEHRADKHDFSCNLPVICIKGLPLRSATSEDSLCLRIVPIKKSSWERFMSPSDVASYKGQVKTTLMYEYYLSGNYTYLDTSYEIRAVLPAESYMFYDKAVYVKGVLITVVPVGERVKYKTFQKGLGILLRSQSDTTAFHPIGRHFLRFDTIDLPRNRVVVTVRDSASVPGSVLAPSSIADAMAYRLGSGTQQDVLPPGRMALLHFSGSWCKPCHAALPGLKKLHRRYGAKLPFATLLAERSAKIAAATYRKDRLPWPGFYEPLSCQEPDCLQKRLGISMFPTYVLVGSKGEVLARANDLGTLGAALQKLVGP